MLIGIVPEDRASLNEDLGVQQQPPQLSWPGKEDWILACNGKSLQDLNEASSVVVAHGRFSQVWKVTGLEAQIENWSLHWDNRIRARFK